MRIAVAGGTGTLGGHVVEALQAAGHEPVSLSRSSGADLVRGDGLADLLRGADAVVDASSVSSTSAKASVAFFGAVTRNLLRAERETGVAHHVAVSIVGAAKVRANYYAGKALQEELVMAEEGGWSLLRATQFHEFAAQLVEHGKVGPFQVVPTMRSQPIAVTEVAVELAAIAAGEPAGLVPDLAGPREERMADLVRRYLAARGTGGRVLEVPVPGAWGRGMRDGSLLPDAGARLGKQTFDEWLGDVAPGRAGAA